MNAIISKHVVQCLFPVCSSANETLINEERFANGKYQPKMIGICDWTFKQKSYRDSNMTSTTAAFSRFLNNLIG